MNAPRLETVLRSATQQVVIGHDTRFCLIGERINPTGRRIFQEQLRAGDLSAIERDVKAQVEGGADVLDVNMGVPLTDEAASDSSAIAPEISTFPEIDFATDTRPPASMRMLPLTVSSVILFRRHCRPSRSCGGIG